MVRAGIGALVAAGVACAPVQRPDPGAPHVALVDHHDLSVDLSDGVLKVRDVLTLAAGGGVLAFRLRQGLWLDSVRASGVELDYDDAALGDDGRVIRVDLPRRTRSVVVELSGDPGHGASNEFVHLPGHSGWYPAPVGGRAARFDVALELPAGLQAMGSGRRTVDEVDGKRRRVRFEAHLPVRGWTLTAGRYHVRTEAVDGVPVSTWLLADDPALSKVYLDATAAHLREGVSRFGPFPHPGFAIVEVPFPAGQGHPGYTLLGSRILRLPFIPDTSARHELFHCWWGNGVMADPRSGNWSEGLTSYLADHEAAARAEGDGGESYRWQVLYDSFNFGRKDPTPLLELVHAQADRTLGYGKATMVFHMLRRRLGDEVFDAALRRAATESLGTQIDWIVLLSYFEAESGRSLDVFIEHWLRSPTPPKPVPPDGQAHMWTELSHELVAPSFDLVARDPDKRVIVLAPEFQEVAEKLADKDWPLVPADQADLTDHSALIVARRGQPITVGGKTLAVPTDRPWLPGTTLLFAASPSWAPGRSVGVVLADDLARLEQAVAKLKWYSRYGWLVFDGARNIDKGIVAP